jgi:hypothetical protein
MRQVGVGGLKLCGSKPYSGPPAVLYLSMPISARDGVLYPQSSSHILAFLVIANSLSHLSFSTTNIITHFSLPITYPTIVVKMNYAPVSNIEEFTTEQSRQTDRCSQCMRGCDCSAMGLCFVECWTACFAGLWSGIVYLTEGCGECCGECCGACCGGLCT